MKRLAVFDFDSTLMDGETIDFFAEPLGLKEQVAQITEEAMAGRLDFFTALIARAKLLKGLDVVAAKAICLSLPMMPGAKETVAGLKAQGYTVVCFSGGFRQATEPACQKLGIDADFANFLYADAQGRLTGEVGGEMMYSNAKGDMIVRLQALMGIGMGEHTQVVGTVTDHHRSLSADTRIAFNAREVLRREATHCIDVKDLSLILDIVRG